MSSEFGKNIKITIFGQSHSEAIGAVIDGLPAGEEISHELINAFMARRAPGKNAYSTKRREADAPKILSGLLNGKTCGAPLCAVIENTDANSVAVASSKRFTLFKSVPAAVTAPGTATRSYVSVVPATRDN
jgi:chorismate synthase